MKHPLHLLAFILALLTLHAQSQVTQLSNNTNIRTGIALGNKGVLVDSSGNLWVTDGTQAGTIQYTSKVTVDTSQGVAVLNGKIYFAGITSTTGSELWATDGTDAGTLLVHDIRTGTGSSQPRDLTVYGNALYFFASTVDAGIELWRSDGTDLGTTMVKDINPGTASSYNSKQTYLFPSNNSLFFDADDSTHGTELWKTDGTAAGTDLVADINPGTASSDCSGFITYGTIILFSANDGTHGTELWKTDGTTSGTTLVADLASGTGSSPGQFVPFQGKIFFIAIIGGKFDLFSTDGTTANTVLVKSFGVGAVPILATSVIINNKLYFSNFGITNGLELWFTDGTTAGTSIFIDINQGSASSGAFILPDFSPFLSGGTGDIHTSLYNGKIFFLADDGTHGTELWITDGTVAGTHMVKDINPGAGSSISSENLSWFYTTTGLYFAATDGSTGNELYKTDSTSAGTVRDTDINVGPGNSNPSFLFMYLNSHIYFTADNGDNSTGLRDLYILNDAVVLPVSLIDFAAAFNGKTVDLKWSTATETNTKNFSVQRSYDAVHFQTIGTVNAAGNSATKKDYGYNDASALNGSSTIYYRLMITDKDGKSAYSKIASVQINASGNVLTLYPNPVKDRLNFITGNTMGDVQVKITDQSGKVVLVQKINSVQQGIQNTIDVSNLAKGVYHLQLITTTGKQTSQFVKF